MPRAAIDRLGFVVRRHWLVVHVCSVRGNTERKLVTDSEDEQHAAGHCVDCTFTFWRSK